MTPIGRHIVVKTINEEIKTESGLLLSASDTNDMRYKRGIIHKVGIDVTPVIKEGQEIYYDKARSYTMVIDNEQFTIIMEHDVVVVI